MLEKDIERWLGNELRKAGYLYYKFVSPANPGVPDRLIICPDGAVVFVELKTERGRLSKQQEACIQLLRDRGQTVAVLRGITEARTFAWMLIGFHGKGGAERGTV